MNQSEGFVLPNWPVPPNVRSVVTTRLGGSSQPPYGAFNLATHVGEAAELVARNRDHLKAITQLKDWLWLKQIHGTYIARCATFSDKRVDWESENDLVEADGSFTDVLKQACVVLTADCVPVLFCDQQGTQVAAAHAGWRGLAGGILERALMPFSCKRSSILAYIGPCIHQAHFEVGEDVKLAFLSQPALKKSAIDECFALGHKRHKYQADLVQLTKLILNAQGVDQIYGGVHCTVDQNDLFYSHRREGVTGRTASGIWMV